ncbi:ephrin-A2 isoform X2 [Genypterus blacodes]|uniref:ephrin-A2 isoform X2 n=1 Tax=Genypterus blacodes TaxID=154954 RepID=UPI003F7618EB
MRMGSPMWTPGAIAAWKAALFLLHIASAAAAKRHVVYWNSTNTRLTAGDLSIQVNVNDYLDIYCPHYPDTETPSDPGQPETLALYLIAETSFQGCVETKGALKRWECNSPHAQHGPVRFSEKIQRFTPFSLGFEFIPGHHYYYSSMPTDEGPPLPCMKLCVKVLPTSEGSKQKQDTQTHPRPHPRGASSSSKTSLPLLLLLLLLPLTI